MKRSRIALAGILAVGLAGSVSASAMASDGTSAHRKPVAHSTAAPDGGCPAPPDGAEGPGRIQVKDGKVYVDGKVAGDAPKDGEPLLVVIKNGKVYVGDEARKVEPGLSTQPPPGVPGVPGVPGRPPKDGGPTRVVERGVGTGDPAGPGHAVHAEGPDTADGPVGDCTIAIARVAAGGWGSAAAGDSDGDGD